MATSTIATAANATITYPPLTIPWIKPENCSTHWTYSTDSEQYYWGWIQIFQDDNRTKDSSCRPPRFNDGNGTFSPGACPPGYMSWGFAVVDASITSAGCCPSGYISFGGACASMYTNSTSVTVVIGESTLGNLRTVLGTAPPGIAFVSQIFVMYQSTDMGVLSSLTPSTSPSPSPLPSAFSFDASPTSVPAQPNSTDSSAAGGESGSSGGLSPGAVAGIAIGAAVAGALLLAAVVYIFLLQRRLRAAREREREGRGGDSFGGAGSRPTEVRELDPARVSVLRQELEAPLKPMPAEMPEAAK